jgi:hypothetical protein
VARQRNSVTFYLLCFIVLAQMIQCKTATGVSFWPIGFGLDGKVSVRKTLGVAPESQVASRAITIQQVILGLCRYIHQQRREQKFQHKRTRLQ